MMAGERRSPWFTGLIIAMALLCLLGLALLPAQKDGEVRA